MTSFSPIRLAITPSQYDDESSIGFALRIAQVNGFQYLSRMLSVTQINKLVRGKGLQLTDSLGIKGMYYDNQAVVRTPLFQQSWQINSKVCLTCIRELGYIKAEVQQPFIACCSVHHCTFIDKCSQCNQQLKWDINLLKGICTADSCCVKLSDSPIDEPYLSQLNQLTSPQIADCLLISTLLSTPNKTIIEPSKFCSTLNYYQQLGSGYKLLTDKDKFTTWLTSFFEQQSIYLPSNFLYAQLWLLVENLNSAWPIDNVVEHLTSINFKRIQKPINPLIVSMPAATALLETTPQSLKKFSSMGLIKKQNNSRLTINSRIDVSPIIQLLSQHTVESDMNSLNSMRDICLKHTIEQIDIMQALLEGDITLGYKPSNTLPDSIYCRKNELIKVGEKVLLSKQSSEITLIQASHITGFSLDELITFRKKGLLKQPVAYSSYCFMSDAMNLKNKRHNNKKTDKHTLLVSPLLI
ncbi:hypothetical protein Q4591_12800 [Shewanella sp. 3_MG-2023]|uniref:hypothetical protein n=1 Tax=Shewanella sp. 3_MG-2023 TaxID=3062635 RepID=UPI0026E408E9|nr:hypothetical protein [Shewanella sp. 3_MG-2023]MDO6776237.1 hypothetical protein [Shewanella sp. 3_MG-2023]